MAMTCYTDVGGDLASIVLSPATLVSSAEKWVEFDREWNKCLSIFNVTSLHMRHFAHSQGEYESWRWDEPKRRRFLSGLLTIIDEYTEYMAAVAVYPDAYERVDAVYCLSENMRPFTMGCLGNASKIKIWSNENSLDWNDFIWLYEKGDQDQNELAPAKRIP